MKGKRAGRSTGTTLGRVAKLSRKSSGLFRGSGRSDSTNPIGRVPQKCYGPKSFQTAFEKNAIPPGSNTPAPPTFASATRKPRSGSSPRDPAPISAPAQPPPAHLSQQLQSITATPKRLSGRPRATVNAHARQPRHPPRSPRPHAPRSDKTNPISRCPAALRKKDWPPMNADKHRLKTNVLSVFIRVHLWPKLSFRLPLESRPAAVVRRNEPNSAWPQAPAASVSTPQRQNEPISPPRRSPPPSRPRPGPTHNQTNPIRPAGRAPPLIRPIEKSDWRRARRFPKISEYSRSVT